jgi:serine/threonine protein kinase/tetratricopeptide (TPR) repeat protein
MSKRPPDSSEPQPTLLHVGPAPAPQPSRGPPTPPGARRGGPPPPPPPKRAAAPVERADRITGVLDERTVVLERGKPVPGTRYRIVRRIGDGGMGTVYEAEHLDLDRRVALKVLLPELTRSKEALQLFRTEARSVSRVGSRNIVEIYDFGELPDGRLMFTMELLAGPTLRQELALGTIASGRAIAILRQLCKGLAAAHAAGIVHRDIKPDNIVLETRGGRSDLVKILDFGIATMLDEDSGVRPVGAGTPHYLAPELISGASFDGRADVYAVGCTAYEMLVGHPPFAADRPADVQDVLGRHMVELPDAPSKVRPELGIPAELDAVVMRCLAKLPSNRFRNMDELEAALCNAQIDAGLQTTWDDLPLPDTADIALRDRLLREMPDPTDPLEERSHRWVWPLVAAVCLVGGVVATYLVVTRGSTSEQPADDGVDALVAEARAAAARSWFVYPPSDDPKAPTAYAKVRELEGLGTAKSRTRAAELRAELADTLLRLGDAYWERDGGRPFAVEYYTQALVFDRTAARAIERSQALPAELDALEEKASVQDFSEAEILENEPLMVLAGQDDIERARRLDKLRAAREDKATDSKIAELLATTPPTPQPLPQPQPQPSAAAPTSPATKAVDPFAPTPASGAAAAPAAEPAEPDAAEDDAEVPAEPTKPSATKAGAEEQAGAKDLADSGRAALKAGDRDKAESLFKMALTYDADNAASLAGLVEIYKGKGATAKAATYADKLAAATGSAAHHLDAGDLRRKLGDTDAAKKHYQRAAALGDKTAAARLAELGGAPEAKPEAPSEDEPDGEGG